MCIQTGCPGYWGPLTAAESSGTVSWLCTVTTHPNERIRPADKDARHQFFALSELFDNDIESICRAINPNSTDLIDRYVPWHKSSSTQSHPPNSKLNMAHRRRARCSGLDLAYTDK